MALTRQQKILGIVVALGLGVVGLDRLVFSGSASGPASASASGALNQAMSGAAKPATDPATPSQTPERADENRRREVVTGHPALSSRLQALAASQALNVEEMIDAFAPRGAWAQAPTEAPRPAPPEKPFDQRHTLDAVMAGAGTGGGGGGGGGVAIVDGRTLSTGNLYDGYVLKRIGEASATFERDGEEVTLRLPGADRGR